MKKKHLILLLILSLLLVGCGSDKKEETDVKEDSLEEYNAKKENYIGISNTFVNVTRTKINQARDIMFFSKNRLLMVPVGETYYKDGGNSCVNVESDSKSPFSGTWKYAYVGVTYDGDGYLYYYVAEDEAGYAIAFTKFEDVRDNKGDLVAKDANKAYSNYLSNQYKIKDNDVHKLNDTEKELFKDLIPNNVTEVFYVSSSNCKADA